MLNNTIYHDIVNDVNIHDTSVVDSTAGVTLMADLDTLCAGCFDGSDLPNIDSISVSAFIFRPPRLPYSCRRRCCSAKWRCFAASALCFCISASSDGAAGLPTLRVQQDC